MKGQIRSVILLLLLFLIAFSALAKADSGAETLGDIFADLGISMAKTGDFIVYKNILREGLENTFWTIAAQSGERVIKIEVIKNIDAEDAAKYIKERQYIIESLYTHIPSPYPGMISKTIECPDEFKPEIVSLEIDGKDTPIYILYSTPRFTYGVGVEDLIKYRGALAFIYCEKQEALYQIEFFIPKRDFNKKEILSIFSSIRSQKETNKKIREKNIQQIVAIEEKVANIQGEWGNYQDYNLILIGFDPLGAKHISSYGYFRNTTPNLDKFSKKAFLFKKAISPSSWTLPVFMSWFTSLYPSQHKIVNKYVISKDGADTLSNLSEISPSVITLAQILKKNGYSTAGFTGNAGVGGIFGYNLGFDTYYDQTTFAGFDLVLPMALDWLKKHREEKFFLFIQAYDVHGRYQHPGDFKNKFVAPSYKGKYKGTPEEYWKLRNLSLKQECLDISNQDVKFWRDWYDGKIYEADKKLGKFLKEIEKLGIADRTIIVVSSASGNEFYEHKKFDHGYSLYDEVIHVPLIIKVPGDKGKEIKNQVRTIDIMPTVLELLDIPCDKRIENQMQGVSLLPLIQGKALQLDAFSETDYLLQVFKRSVRTSDGWKFIYSMDTGERELYNLKVNPQELNNLVEKEKRIAYELEQKLFNWLQAIKQDN